mmetsp:Transcript_57501/g.125080  ORF Transcript_57501/g.125080 Transcript_57501/m.125080 type:complete len:264 (-) Transcript_57501:1007-1798(-)
MKPVWLARQNSRRWTPQAWLSSRLNRGKMYMAGCKLRLCHTRPQRPESRLRTALPPARDFAVALLGCHLERRWRKPAPVRCGRLSRCWSRPRTWPSLLRPSQRREDTGAGGPPPPHPTQARLTLLFLLRRGGGRRRCRRALGPLPALPCHEAGGAHARHHLGGRRGRHAHGAERPAHAGRHHRHRRHPGVAPPRRRRRAARRRGSSCCRRPTTRPGMPWSPAPAPGGSRCEPLWSAGSSRRPRPRRPACTWGPSRRDRCPPCP